MILPVVLWVAQTVFPSDGVAPAKADPELIRALCPAGAPHKDGYLCSAACPKFTSDSYQRDWYVNVVTRGHFLSPESDDAVVATHGCEPHSYNFGGAVLMTKVSDRWKMQWYKGGIETSQCHKITRRDGREILVCIGHYGGQGNIWEGLYVEDLLTPTGVLMAGGPETDFFEAFDNTRTCGWDSKDPPHVIKSAILEVKFAPASVPGSASLTVSAEFAKKQLTPEQVADCVKSSREAGRVTLYLPTKSFTLDFLFDGHTFKLAPASSAAARVFGDR